MLTGYGLTVAGAYMLGGLSIALLTAGLGLILLTAFGARR